MSAATTGGPMTLNPQDTAVAPSPSFPRRVQRGPKRSWLRGAKWATAAIAQAGLLCVHACALAADRAKPVEPLAWVRGDAALVAELHDLDDVARRVQSGALGREVVASPLWGLIQQSSVGQTLAKVDAYLQRQAQRSVVELAREIGGRRVILALFRETEGDPQGLVILQGRDAAAMTNAVALSIKVEPKARLTELRHANRTYMKRQKANERPLFVAQIDDALVLSDHEHQVQTVLERIASGDAADDGFHRSPIYLPQKERWIEGAALTVVLRPRAWDSALQHVEPKDAWIPPLWARCESLGACVSLGDRTSARLHWRWNREGPPPWLAPFAASANEGATATSTSSSEAAPLAAFQTLRAVPESTPVAGFAGRLRPSPWLDLIEASLTDRDTHEWKQFLRVASGLLAGRNMRTEAIPLLLNDVAGVIVTEPAKQGARWNVVASWNWEGLRSQQDWTQPLDNALSFAWNFLAAWLNGEGRATNLVFVERSGSAASILEGWDRWRPGYAVRADGMTLAARWPRETSTPLHVAEWDAWRTALAERCDQSAFVDFAALRSVIAAHRESLGADLPDGGRELFQGLARMNLVVGPFRRFFMAHTQGDSAWEISASVDANANDDVAATSTASN